jgi:hypothetical protein
VTYRPKRDGKTLSSSKIRRKSKRKRRRLVEANDPDWARWDATAVLLGLAFAELARRALTRLADDVEARDPRAFEAARARAEAALAVEDDKPTPPRGAKAIGAELLRQVAERSKLP